MPDDEHNREKEIFHGAMERAPGGERDAYLEEACGGDAALRCAVEELVEAYAEPHRILADADGGLSGDGGSDDLGDAVAPVPHRWREGDTVDRFKLVRKLGDGGMGEVWMAQQQEPVRRSVAVKIIKLGMDSEEVIARFVAERQALALMDHPNIATIFDGGVTANGRPFFAMELVEGPPITTFCDEHLLSLGERLRMFAAVCRAVQHAHQKGVIHRDIKPSNVLVAKQEGEPVPKVIDFGVAKSVGHALTERTFLTRVGVMVGTPAYMSPEQAESAGADVDTRSDVYSLGVLLYELVTGETPFSDEDLVTTGLGEMLRRLREVVPPVPSKKVRALHPEVLSGVEVRRGAKTGKLAKMLEGDLDLVVMKALEKNPARRYRTPEDLADDVENFLGGRAVTPVPPSRLQSTWKWIKRNRRPVAAAAAFVFLVVTGAGVWLAEKIKKEQAHREIVLLTEVFDQVQDFFKDELVSKDVSRIVEATIQRYELHRETEGIVASESARRFYSDLWATLGASYRDQGDYAAARQAYARSLAEREALYREFPDDVGNASILSGAYASLAKIARDTLDYTEATEYFGKALQLNHRCLELAPGSRMHQNNLAATLTSLGICRFADGETAEASRHFREAESIKRKLSRGAPDTAQGREDLAYTLLAHAHLLHADRPPEGAGASKTVEEILRIRRRRSEAAPEDIGREAALAASLNFASRVAIAEGDSATGRELASQAHGHWNSILAKDGSRVDAQEGGAVSQILLAQVALASDDPTTARSLLQAAAGAIPQSPRSPFIRLEFFLAQAETEHAVGAGSDQSHVALRHAEQEMERLVLSFPRHPVLQSHSRRLVSLRGIVSPEHAEDPAL